MKFSYPVLTRQAAASVLEKAEGWDVGSNAYDSLERFWNTRGIEPMPMTVCAVQIEYVPKLFLKVLEDKGYSLQGCDYVSVWELTDGNGRFVWHADCMKSVSREIEDIRLLTAKAFPQTGPNPWREAWTYMDAEIRRNDGDEPLGEG